MKISLKYIKNKYVIISTILFLHLLITEETNVFQLKELFLSDNKTVMGTQKDPSDWSYVDNRHGLDIFLFKTITPPVWPTGLTPMSSADVKESVLKNAGARPWDRDSVDKRVVNDARNLTGAIIDTPAQVGGWPQLNEKEHLLSLPSNPHADDDGDGYTNLEEWVLGFER